MSLANLCFREVGKAVLAAHLVTLREGEIRYWAGNEQVLAQQPSPVSFCLIWDIERQGTFQCQPLLEASEFDS